MSDARADVYNKYEKYVRTYSLKQHGEEYFDLATGYAKKIGGTVQPKKKPKLDE